MIGVDESASFTRDHWHLQGVEMNTQKMMVVLQSAAAATVVSVLVSVVGAGTKWMGN